MKEVIPGIYQLEIPYPKPSNRRVNSYLVRGDDGHLLVDVGWNTDAALASMRKQLAEIDVGIEDISQIVITHVHPDHYGQSGRLKQLSPAKLALHHLERDMVESRYINMDDLLKQLEHWLSINGVPADELPMLQTISVGMARFVTPTMPDIVLRGGETIATGLFNFEVLWTPGHSPGHVSLYEPAHKVLISGDYILPTITPNIGLHPQSGSNPLNDYLTSLNMLKRNKLSYALPGHGSPFTGVEQRINEIIQHHGQRNLEILETIKTEPKTAYQIATETPWKPDTNPVGWQELPLMDKRRAMMETLSHLEFMRSEGRVDKFSRNGVICYQSVSGQ